MGSDTARFRPEPSVAADVVEEGFEFGEFLGRDVIGFYVARFMVAVVEAVSCNEPAGAHFCFRVPRNSLVDILVCKVCCPSFAGAHLELVGLVFVCDFRALLLLLLGVSCGCGIVCCVAAAISTTVRTLVIGLCCWGSVLLFSFECQREAEFEGPIADTVDQR